MVNMETNFNEYVINDSFYVHNSQIKKWEVTNGVQLN